MNDKPITTSPKASAIEPLKPMIEDEQPAHMVWCMANNWNKPCYCGATSRLIQKAFNKGYELGKRETARVMGTI